MLSRFNSIHAISKTPAFDEWPGRCLPLETPSAAGPSILPLRSEYDFFTWRGNSNLGASSIFGTKSVLAVLLPVDVPLLRM